MRSSQAVVAHAFNPSTWEAEAGKISVSSRPTWFTRASFRTGFKATEKPCLEKKNNKKKYLSYTFASTDH